LALPESEVWQSTARQRWLLAWTVTWIAQVPFWRWAFPANSPLLIYGIANAALTIHRIGLRVLKPIKWSFPSSTLASEDGRRRSNVWKVMASRTGLPLVFMVCHGVPDDWRVVLPLLLLDVLPLISICLAMQVGLLAPKSLRAQLAWRLRYSEIHSGDSAPLDDDDDCNVHGNCSICLSILCCRSLASKWSSMASAVQQRVAPGLSAVRQRRLTQGWAISAARATAKLGGTGRIAVLRCGHTFHSHCISEAAETLPRCPQCRAGIFRAAPDEDTLNSQALCLLLGLVQGAALLGTLWMLRVFRTSRVGEVPFSEG